MLNPLSCDLTLCSITDSENPFQDLFLWSILMNRHKLAVLFWKQGKVMYWIIVCQAECVLQ